MPETTDTAPTPDNSCDSRMKGHTMPNTLDVVVGGQFGSEAKGRVTLDQIRRRLQRATPHNHHPIGSMRVGGPNAGHVVLDPQGRRWAMRALPVGFVEPEVELFIAAGSEIDFEVLSAEIQAVEAAGYEVRDRLFIHPEATVLEPHHIVQETESDLNARLGSTAKGIGAARSERVWRVARRVADLCQDRDSDEDPTEWGVVADFEPWLIDRYNSREDYHLVIEGTQGYGLGQHAGHYPQCTSGDCRAVDFLAQAGVGPWHLPNYAAPRRIPGHVPSGLDPDVYAVHVVIRPYPIRVAGNSGELAGETTWSDLGLPDEHTTVTQKVRRVGQFDPAIVRRAVEANGVDCVRIHLSMADQVAPELAGHTDDTFNELTPPALVEWWSQVPYADRIASIGTGPDTHLTLPLAFE